MFGKIWSNPLCCCFLGYRPADAGRTFLDVANGNDNREDWSKICRRDVLGTLVVSCCLFSGCYDWVVVPEIVDVAVLVVVKVAFIRSQPQHQQRTSKTAMYVRNDIVHILYLPACL